MSDNEEIEETSNEELNSSPLDNTDLEDQEEDIQEEEESSLPDDEEQLTDEEEAPEESPDEEEPTFKPWMKQLPEDLKENEVLNQYDKPGDLCQAHLKLLEKGEGTLKWPENQEEVEDFYKAIGRPDSPAGYHFENIEFPDLPDIPEMRCSQDHIDSYKQWAFDMGLSELQAEEIYKRHYEYNIREYIILKERQVRAARQVEGQLLEKWGDKGFNKNMRIISNTIDTFIPPDRKKAIAELMDLTDLGNQPYFLEFMLNIGKAMLEDTFIEGEHPTPEKGGALYPSMDEEEGEREVEVVEDKHTIVRTKIGGKD